jgi:hypothetical protein
MWWLSVASLAGAAAVVAAAALQDCRLRGRLRELLGCPTAAWTLGTCCLACACRASPAAGVAIWGCAINGLYMQCVLPHCSSDTKAVIV